MSCIWAVARNMVAESIRMKIAVVFIAIIVLLLPILPFVVAGDGLTLKSRVQSFLVYSLGSVGFLLSVLTVFLSCASLSNEIRQKSITLIVSKPIARWQFFVGKWLGISLLNAGLLLLTGVIVWTSTYFLKSLPTTVPNDRAAVEHEVWNVRHAMTLPQPDFETQIDETIRELREEDRLSDISALGQQSVRTQIRRSLEASWRTIQPRASKVYTFPGLLVDREDENYLHLRFKPVCIVGRRDAGATFWWFCGDRNEPQTLTEVQTRAFPLERFSEVPVPTYAVNKDNVLYVHLANGDPELTYKFEGKDSFELLLGIGTFHWNLFRALSVIWCRLAFLAALGVMMSSWLSFPVACMACFMVLITASSASFFAESIEAAYPNNLGEDPLWVIGPATRPLAKVFLWLVPDFSKYDAVGNVASGRNVTLLWVIDSLVILVLIKSVILAMLGCVVLTKRELAQVVV